ncbi:hypothetical protein pipiens_007741 [Culex pipiens pipiens]|uniref:Uncharacterized protein n=1 Tax=Culex pipiens pipiens TaxID=38569 RepID=A0ABD1DK05_CULPP
MSGLQQILVYSGDSESEGEDELVPEMSTSGTPPPYKVPVKRKEKLVAEVPVGVPVKRKGVEELVAAVPTPGTPPKVPVGVPVKRKGVEELVAAVPTPGTPPKVPVGVPSKRKGVEELVAAVPTPGTPPKVPVGVPVKRKGVEELVAAVPTPGTPPKVPVGVPVKRKGVEELVAAVPTPGTPPKVPVGVPVKRKVFRERAHQERKNKHTVISKNCGCILQCFSKLSRDRRLEINQAYWKLSLPDQRSFILTYSSRSGVKRRRIKSNLDGSGYKKRYTFKYSLQADGGAEIEVCAWFFLNTLGYNEKCNSVIYRAYAAADKEELGAEKPEQKPSSLTEIVKADILSYKPTISHYRREHAPNVLYLPSDLSCAKMYTSFNESRIAEQKDSCSYNFYYKVMARLKIRFTKLGHELCEKCRIAEVHFKSSGHRSNQKDEQEFRQTGLELNPEDQPDCVEQSEDSNDEDEASCKVCATWLEHRGAAIASRVQYDQDRVISGDLVVSVDLEKVIQLPRMDRFKEVMFAKRIVALNETFAPLGGGQNGPVQAILWNETTSGRKAPDIMTLTETRTITAAKDTALIC